MVALDRRAPFEDVRDFAHELAELLADRHPELLTTAARKQARKRRLYLDIQCNAYGQSAVTPHAVRALPGAPVATPLSWSELDDPDLTPQRWTPTTIDERLASDDPWKQELRRGRSLKAADRRLEKL
ncbi:hypothetical protein ACGF13_20740 [Kitasatospora sp. NPDC048286]|uniref:non-homologous end-joining DNA ligase LigD n=1 Tax=Kitasatospora sp. NPDC048286 TaxID=3364047 RepID=UPI003713A48D